MVDVTHIYGNGIQKLEVRFKDKNLILMKLLMLG